MLTLLSGISGVVTALAAFLLITRFLLRRCYVYVYLKDGRQKVPALVGYVKADGTFIDITRKLPEQRAAGQVAVRDEKGRVVLFFTETGDEQEREIGSVDAEGNVFGLGDVPVGKVSPDGQRYWWELWLRRHADVPEGDEDPVGKCVEPLRLRTRRPNELTPLARGGAALLLYYRKLRPEDETPRTAPHVMWDTALPSAFLFSLLFLVPGMTNFVEEHEFLLNVLGRAGSYVATGLGIYLLLWVLLHFIKVTLLSYNNEVHYYLALLNRQTGIRTWSLVGAGLAFVGFADGLLKDQTTYLPLYLASLVGLGIAYGFATHSPWPVRPRSRADVPSSATAPPPAEGDIVREYRWEFDTPFKRFVLSTEARFSQEEIDEIRRANPFSSNWEAAAAEARRLAPALVRDGEAAPQARQITAFLRDASRRNRLTPFEELQMTLGFVQTPNIDYALDENCEEIDCRPEYFRHPAETLFDKRGDCDCKSVLAAALMRSLGYPVLLLLSPQAGHAAVAVGGAPQSSDASLFFFSYEGENYYYCETTGEGWRVGQETDYARLMKADVSAIIDLTV